MESSHTRRADPLQRRHEGDDRRRGLPTRYDGVERRLIDPRTEQDYPEVYELLASEPPLAPPRHDSSDLPLQSKAQVESPGRGT